MTIKYDLDRIINGNDNQTNFTTQLLKLIFKADAHNKELLRQGFPNAVLTIEEYRDRGIFLDLEQD